MAFRGHGSSRETENVGDHALWLVWIHADNVPFPGLFWGPLHGEKSPLRHPSPLLTPTHPDASSYSFNLRTCSVFTRSWFLCPSWDRKALEGRAPDSVPRMSLKAFRRQRRGTPCLVSPTCRAQCFAHSGCWLMSTE